MTDRITIQEKNRLGAAMLLTTESGPDVLAFLLHERVNAHWNLDAEHPITIIDGRHGTTRVMLGSYVTVFDGLADWAIPSAFASRYETLEDGIRRNIIEYVTGHRQEIIDAIRPTLAFERSASFLGFSDEDLVGVVLNAIGTRLAGGAPVLPVFPADANAWEREGYTTWLEEHDGTFEEYREFVVDTTPWENGGAA